MDNDADSRLERRSAAAPGGLPLLEALEPRMLFSAEPFGLVSDMLDAPLVTPASSFAQVSTGYELVLINDNIDDKQTLIADLQAQAENGRQVAVHVLDSTVSGVEQVADILAGYDSLAALHLLSHGNDSGVQLGGSWIDQTGVQANADAFADWRSHLQDDANLLIYGCDLAASDRGVAMLTELASLTGAAIAASDDPTGHTLLQGDWDLEYRSDDVSVQSLFSGHAQDAWLDELATFTFRNEDASGYTQAVDTHLLESADTDSHAEQLLLRASQQAGSASQTLLHFDDVIGDVAGRLPAGSSISSATLMLEIASPAEPGTIVSLYPMLQGWDENASWSGFDAGVSTDDVEASSIAVASFAADVAGQVYVDVTASVQAWLEGDANFGWVLLSDADGSELQIQSSESAAVVARPMLTIVSDSLTVSTTDDIIDAPDLNSTAALIANPGADGVISLREAVIATNNTSGADAIYLPAGVYEFALAGNYEVAAEGGIDVLDELTILGAGSNSTIIDANGIDRHFDVRDNGGSSRLSLNDLALVNGDQNFGGSVSVQSGSALSLSGVLLADNTTGGSGDGGAIHSDGTLVVSGSTFERNTADTREGGAIFAAGALSISDSRFTQNTAKNGGAVLYKGTGAFKVENADFSDNTATDHGGAIDASSGAVTIKRSSFHGNFAAKGGAINVDGSANTAISHTTVSGNFASSEGGGIRARGAGNVVDIQSSTIAFNDAVDGGGYDNNGDVTTSIGNSIFDGNTINGTTPNAFRDPGGLLSVGYNIVSDNTGNFAQIGDLTGQSANLQALQYATGSNIASHPLYADSPARDSGSPSLDEPDAIGNPRTGVPDRGAAEAFSHPVAHSQSGPVIDGAIDAQWSNSQLTHLLDYGGNVTNVPTDPGASWRAIWDDTALYLLVEVSDTTPFEDSVRIWHDDSIAVYLDPDLSRGDSYDGVDDTNFYIGRGHSTTTMDNDPLSLNASVSSTDSNTGYITEIAIPWAQLGIAPTAGMQIGIELHLNDDADGNFNDTELAWADSQDVAWIRPSSFGAIVLESPVDSAGPDDLNHGVSINTDGGNNIYFEAPASIMLGLGNHTVQTRFSTTVEQGLSVIPWIDGMPISYVLTADMADGQVHTLTQIWNSDTGYRAVYLDGTLLWDEINAANIGKTVTSTQPLVIGQSLQSGGEFNPSGFFSGTIHDVRIWDYALEADEITDNLHRQFSAHTPPVSLIANWRFDRLSGDANDRVVDLINPGTNDMLVKRRSADGSSWVDSSASDVPTIDDNAAVGEIVAHLRPSDAEVVNDTFDYWLFNDAGGRFTIDPGGQLLIGSSEIEGGASNSQLSVGIRVTDESGNSFDQSLAIGTQPVNEAPGLSGLPAHDKTFYGAPIVLGEGLLPDDPELTAEDDYSGFEVTLHRDGGPNAEDVFSLGSLQAGTDIILTDTDTSILVGEVLQNGGGVLQMRFLFAAKTAQVRDVLRAITYANSGDNSVVRSVDLLWTLNDNNTGAQGSGGALSATQLQTVQISPPDYQAVDDDLGTVLSADTLSIPLSTLTGNDTGNGAATPFLVGVTSPNIGTLTDNAGVLELNTAAGASGTTSFEYTAGIGNSNIVSQWPLAVDGIDEAGQNTGIAVTDGPAHELQFDGDDYVEIPNFNYPSEFTLTFDFKVNDLGNSDEEVLISQGEYESNNSLVVWITGDAFSPNGRAGKLITNIWDSTDTDDGYNGYAYDITSFEGDGQWHNYAVVVRQGVGTSIYIDGVQQDTSSHTRGDAPFTPVEPLYVGAEEVLGGLDYHLQRHQIANLRLIDGFDAAAIAANEVNQYSSATASVLVRNEEMLSTNNTVTVAEDTTVAISSAFLETVDVEDEATDLVYTITDAADFGDLLLDGTAIGLNQTFSQQDIDGGKLAYRHGGGELATADSVGLRVDDSAGSQTDLTFSFTLVPINDAPTLAEGSLASIQEDDSSIPGDTIANIFAGQFGDVDGSFAGIAITGDATTTQGVWQYSTDGGTWFDVAPVSAAFALLLDVTTLLRFAPVANWHGTFPDLSIHGVDDSTSGLFTSGATRQTADLSIVGGATPYSSTATRIDSSAASVNDAPVLTDGLLADIAEGDSNPGGDTVANIFSSAFSDVDGSFGGIAITSNLALSEGLWQYSTDAGSNWHSFPAVTENFALMLDVNAMLRFLPGLDYAGVIPALTLFGVDDTGGPYTSGALAEVADLTVRGGTTPYSQNPATVNSGVADINDSPLLGDSQLAGITEDTAQPPGATVADIFAGQFSDIDGTLAGVAISDNAAAVAQGQWQTSFDAGLNWQPLGAVSPASALAVDAAAMLRFVPAAHYYGAIPALQVHAIDSAYSGGFSTAGSSVSADVTSPDNTSPYSSPAATLSSQVFPAGPTDLSRGIDLNTDGGNDSYLVATDGGAIFGGLTEVTMEALFAIDTVNTRNALISYTGASGDDAIKLLVRSGGIIDVEVFGDAVLSAPVPALMDGQLHSVSATWNSSGGELQIFADGALVHSALGIASGQSLPASGTLVLGMEQDSLGGGYEASEVFYGTLHDVRVWSEVRTSGEIAADYFYKLHSENLPDSLIANWQMDGFDGGGEVVDLVAGNNLSVAHVTGSGFSPSTPVGVFSVAENGSNGDVIGTVVGSAPIRGDGLIQDGSFLLSSPGTDVLVPSGATIGGSGGHWHVDSGNVNLLSSWAGSPLGGPVLDLAGDTPGAISQTIVTDIGKTYQLEFALSGNFNSVSQHDLRIGTGSVTTDLSVQESNNWGQGNLLWERRSVSFTATSSETVISFTSLAAGGSEGALIGDIEVTEVDPSIAAILNANPALSYDAGTHKFYLADNTQSDWVTAQANAIAQTLNGVNGRLVTIHSDHENTIVRDLAASIGRNVFLGATDQTTEGQWHWHAGSADGELLWSGAAGGSAPNGVYTNWKSGEPNNHGTGEDHAVMFYSEGNGLWNDAKPAEHYSSIVEWDADAVLSKFNYSIVADSAAAFSIDADTGELSIADITGIDYETDPSYQLTVRVSDAAGEYHDEILTIVIVDANAPQLTAVESTTLSYVENDGSVSISADLAVGDADDTALQSATVTVRDYLAAEDTLEFSDFGSFSSSWDATTGTLTIDGPATVAEWQAALRSVQYLNTSDDPVARSTHIDFIVSDGVENSNIASRPIEIIPVNDAPSLSSDATMAAIDEDDTGSGGVTVAELFSTYFVDPDSTFAAIAVVADATTDQGLWQVSADNGGSWQTLASVSEVEALVLDTSAMLRFLPAVGYHGPVPALVIVAIDNTYTGTFFGDPSFLPVDVSARGDGTPFATDSNSIQSTVRPIGPTDISAGISLNSEGGNDAYLIAADGAALLGGLTALTIESQFAISAPMAMNPLLSYATTDSANALLLAVQDNGVLFVHVDDQRLDVPQTYPELLDGQRHAVAFNWDANHGDFAFYIDGELVHHGSGLKAGYSVAPGGVLVLGQDQDAPDAGYNNTQQFQGRYHDLRIWNEVRTAAEIAQTHQHKLHAAELPGSLIANWQMDDISGAGAVTDVVSGSILNTQHVTESGFTTSTPSSLLMVSEVATNGTAIATLAAHSATQVQDLVTDGLFTSTGATDIEYYGAGQDIGTGGAWHVDSGSVDLDARASNTPLGGTPLDLHGGTAGSISQSLSTEVGKTYQLQFSLTGNFSDSLAKTLSVSAGDVSQNITVDPPDGWSTSNLLWQQRSVTFTATSTTTTLGFASVAPPGGPYGPVIGDVRVTELAPAVAQLLAADSSLSYDGGTGKFYRAVSTPLNWTQANDVALGSELNGVAGHLVTVRSAYENSVVQALAQAAGGNLWLGASDSTTEGQWHWLEAGSPGVQFWQGNETASGGVATNGQYSNWRTTEPNDGSAEDYAALHSSHGEWSDFSAGNLQRYAIEWDGNAVLSNFQFTLNSDPSGAFALDSNTGEISVFNAAALDFEDAPSHDIDVRVTDASGEFYDETITIHVGDFANPVLADIEIDSIDYPENSGAIAISESLTIGGALQTATIAFTSGYVAGEDLLTFVDTGAISHSWDAISGVLTLTGSAGTAEWQQALRSVAYLNDSDDPVSGVRNLLISADNQGELSNNQSRSITVTAINDAPSIASAADLSVNEDELEPAGHSVRDLFTSGFSDPDGDVIGIAVSANAATVNPPGVDQGVWWYSTDMGGNWYEVGEVSDSEALVLSLDSWLRFVPTADYHGQIPSLTVHAMDDSASTDVTAAAVRVSVDATMRGGASAFSADSPLIDGSVQSIFDAPTNTGAVATVFNVVEDVASAIGLSGIELDPRDHAGDLTLRLQTTSGGLLTAGSDPVLAIVSTVDSIELTGTAAQLNAYLDDGNAISYRHGTEHRNGAAADGLVITLIHGSDSAIIGNPVINISSVNDAPHTGESRLEIVEDTPYTLQVSDFEYSDPYDNPVDSLLAIEIVTGPANAQLLLNGGAVVDGDMIAIADIAGGKLELHPEAEASGDNYDAIRYRVLDDGGTLNGGDNISDTAAILTIDVTAVNDLPTLDVTPLALLRGESISLAGHITATDADVPAQQRVVTLSSVPAHGSLQLNGVALGVNGSFTQADIEAGSLHYVHNGEPAIDDSFAIVFGDKGPDATVFSVARILGIAVTETHPQLQPDHVSVGEGQSVDIGVLDNDQAADEPLDLSSVRLIQPPMHGRVSIDDSGVLSYWHNGGESSVDSLSYTVTDSGGDVSQAEVTLSIDPANDSPLLQVLPVTIDLVGNHEKYWQALTQADGSIVAVGGALASDDLARILISRFTSDGSVDTDFGDNGHVLLEDTPFDPSQEQFGYAIANTDDARILIVGHGGDVAFVGRFHSDGSLDTAFGDAGWAQIDLAVASGLRAFDLLVLDDQRIVISGYANTPDDTAYVVQLSADGTQQTPLIPEFAGGIAQQIQLDVSGRLVISMSIAEQQSIMRVFGDGGLDASFDGDGILATGLASGSDNARSVVVQNDGKLVVAGVDVDTEPNAVTVKRFLSDGAVDVSYGTAGLLQLPVMESVSAIAAQSDGRIVVVGAQSQDGEQLVVARVNLDGTLDSTFARGGLLRYGLDSSDWGLGVHIDTDDSILLTGGDTADSENWNAVLLRLSADGDIDLQFNEHARPSVTEQQTATAVSATLRIIDAELTANDNFDGSTLQLQRSGAADLADEFSSVAAELDALDQGADLVFNGVVAGTVLQNSGGTLLLQFNAAATADMVNDIARAIGYTYGADAPPASVALQWQFDDRNAGAQGAGPAHSTGGDVTVAITAINDVPSIALGSGTITHTEADSAVAIAPALVVGDAEYDLLDSTAQTSVSLQRVGGASAMDEFVASGQLGSLQAGADFIDAGIRLGTITDNSAGTLQVRFDAGIDTASISSALRQIAYRYSGDVPPPQVSLQWQFTDGNTGAQGLGGEASGTATSVVTIVATDDRPQITGLSADAWPYIHGAPAVSIASTIDLSDADSTMLSAASIEILDYRPGVDMLALDASNGLDVSWDPTSGILQLTGLADLGSYRSALRALAYHSVDKPADAEIDRVVRITITDDTGSSSDAGLVQVRLTVPEHIVTIAIDDIATRTYIEGAPALSIVPDIVVTSLDVKNVVQATVQIANGIADQDVLQLTDSAGLVSDWDADTATLRISGGADAATYQDVLRSVSYSNSSDDPDPATRQILIALVSESGDSNSLEIDLQPVAVNDSPIADGATLTLAAASSQVLSIDDFGFSDPLEGHSLNSVIIETQPIHGQLLYRGSPFGSGLEVSAQDINDGLLRYTVVNTSTIESAQDIFEYRVRDSGGVDEGGVDLSPEAFFQLDVAPAETVPQPPTPAPWQIDENAAIGTIVGALASLGVEPVFSHLVDGDFAGSVSLHPDVNRHVADGGWYGAQMGGWQVVDGDVDLRGSYWERGPKGGLPLELNGDTAGTIEQRFSTEPGARYRINFALSGDFRDAASDLIPRLQVSAGSQTFELGVNRPLQWSEQNLQWQNQSLEFTATDASTALSFHSLNTGSHGAIIADVEVINVLEYALLNTDAPFSVDAAGLVSVGTGALDHETRAGHTLDLRVADAAGRSVDIQVPVEVLDLNESPQLLVNETLPVIAGSTVAIDALYLAAGDVDEADQQASATIFTVTELPTAATLLLNGTAMAAGDSFTLEDLQQRRVDYQHDGSPAAADQFMFQLHDGGEDGVVGVDGVFSIDVREPLDFIVDDSWSMLEGETVTLSAAHIARAGGFINDADLFVQLRELADSIEFLHAETQMPTAIFTLQDIADGKVLLRHDGSEPVSVNFQLEFQHRSGDDSTVLDSRSIDLNVVDVADAPRGADSEMRTDHLTAVVISEQQLGFDDGDDGDNLSFLLINSLPEQGTLKLSGAAVDIGAVVDAQALRDGELVYIPDPLSSGTMVQTIVFELIDSGDIATGGVNQSAETYRIDVIISSDHKPVASADLVLVEEGGIVSTLADGAISVTDNDRDHDTPVSDLLVQLLRAPEHGVLTLNRDGTFSYRHDGGESRSDAFSYRLADDAIDLDNSDGDIGHVDIEIEPRNDAPQAGETGNREITTNELLRIELPRDLFVDRDIEDSLTITATLADGSPLPGWLEFDPATGVFSGVPDAYGVLSIVVVATDEAGASAETQFEINVEPLLDAVLPAAPAPQAPASFAQTPSVTSAPALAEPDFPVAAGAAPTDGEESTEEDQAEGTSPQQTGTLLSLGEQTDGDSERQRAFEDRVVKFRRDGETEAERETANPLLEEALEIQQLSLAWAFDALSISDAVTQKLDRMKDGISAEADDAKVKVVSGVAISAGLSVGYIVWLVRGGLLLGSVMSAMPAWRWIDPLPVLRDTDGVGEDDTESLQSMVEGESVTDSVADSRLPERDVSNQSGLSRAGQPSDDRSEH